MSEAGAAILGAIVGGAVSALIQLAVFREARVERAALALETKQAQARSLLFKMVRISSDLEGIWRHVCTERQRILGVHPAPQLWEALRGLGNAPREVWFEPSEMAMLLSLRSDEVFNEVIIMDQLHSSTIEIVKLYSAKRDELMTLMAAYTTNMEGMVGVATVQGEERLRLLPRIAQVEQLAHSLVDRAEHDAQSAAATLERLSGVLNDKLSLMVHLAPKGD